MTISEKDLAKQDVSITWHALSADQVLQKLGTQLQSGLTTEEAVRRLEQYGRNELKEKPRPTFLKMVFDQLNNFVVILLIVASIISALLGDYIEAGAIMLIVVLKSVLGVIQESRAEEGGEPAPADHGRPHATVRTTLPVALRESSAFMASAPFSSGKRMEMCGLSLPSPYHFRSSSKFLRASSGSRARQAP